MRLLLSFFRRYVFRYWLWFIFGFICLFLTNWLAVEIPLQLAQAVDGLRNHKHNIVKQSALFIALMGGSIIIIRTLSRVLFFTPGRLVEYQVKNDLFKKLLSLQPSFYAKWQTGDIISRTSDDMTFVRVLVGFGTLQVFNTSTALVLTGIKMFQLSTSLTLLILVPIVISLFIVQIGVRKLFALVKISREQLSDLSEQILSSIHGIQTIQGFRAEAAFTKQFDKRNQAFLQTNLSVAKINAFLLPVLMLGGAVCIWALLAIGGPMAIRGDLSVGQLVAFTAYIAYLLVPLRLLGWVMSVFQRGQASLERVMELLDAKVEQPEGQNPLTLPSQSIALSVKNLSFAYPDHPEKRVLNDISFTLPASSTLGIFGRTGSGKTTLLKLLIRAYNPPKETIFVNGIDITKIELSSWRDKIAMAPQTPFLFSDTIESNIAVGNQTQEEIKTAIANAAFDNDLPSLPDGLNTIVGERGIMLSGGQRQRITLARALAKRFDLLILDDVLSAVDHNTEKRLIATIEALSDSRDHASPTVILVSHRLSALAGSQHILVLEQGKLVDQGTHQELIKRAGPYRDAWLHQSKKQEQTQESSALQQMEKEET